MKKDKSGELKRQHMSEKTMAGDEKQVATHLMSRLTKKAATALTSEDDKSIACGILAVQLCRLPEFEAAREKAEIEAARIEKIARKSKVVSLNGADRRKAEGIAVELVQDRQAKKDAKEASSGRTSSGNTSSGRTKTAAVDAKASSSSGKAKSSSKIKIAPVPESDSDEEQAASSDSDEAASDEDETPSRSRRESKSHSKSHSKSQSQSQSKSRSSRR